MDIKYIDYGEINASDEELIKTRVKWNDKPFVAFRVKNGEENNYKILAVESIYVVEITIKKNDEYTDEITLPLRREFDNCKPCLKFRLKDFDGSWKCGYYWALVNS